MKTFPATTFRMSWHCLSPYLCSAAETVLLSCKCVLQLFRFEVLTRLPQSAIRPTLLLHGLSDAWNGKRLRARAHESEKPCEERKVDCWHENQIHLSLVKEASERPYTSSSCWLASNNALLQPKYWQQKVGQIVSVLALQTPSLALVLCGCNEGITCCRHRCTKERLRTWQKKS